MPLSSSSRNDTDGSIGYRRLVFTKERPSMDAPMCFSMYRTRPARTASMNSVAVSQMISLLSISPLRYAEML